MRSLCCVRGLIRFISLFCAFPRFLFSGFPASFFLPYDAFPEDLPGFSYPMEESLIGPLRFSYLRAERTVVIFEPAFVREEKYNSLH